ncbi:Ras guanine nucleotide exchange factor [Heterostelium album PN500]|uniref:Ras guanine nucleotide exchange factor n=1 Tax=Heterostelium pallidum (strain ATCC 26659 / Pp 5 / PN500) TaxID=670386 RepID=D3BPS2_HETP5|nr:Ras guanine nucleotide exchange factor [Heterostelium album PN500]EFA76205.1 Ras guanine nucleotide exchange factor [Heterostelium album PN500]|eukprot:XP_020428338.1 Ras guanine nucleotide exchange factor [Heterostelium album PN500]
MSATSDQDMHPQDYFEYVLEIIKQVIVETKTLSAINSNDKDQADKILNDAACSVVKNISILIKLMEQFPYPYQHVEHHLSHFMESIKNLSSLVLELIAAARVTKSSSIECVKAVVMSYHNFKTNFFQFEDQQQSQQQQQVQDEHVVQFQPVEEQDEEELIQPEEIPVAQVKVLHETSPPHRGSNSATPTKTAASTASSNHSTPNKPATSGNPNIPSINTNNNESFGDLSNLAAPHSPKAVDMDEIAKIEKGAVNLILNVNRITEASIEGDYDALLAAAKGISNEVMQIAKLLPLKNLGNSLRESAVNVISLSKLVLKNKNDQYYVDQLELAVGKLNDILKNTIFHVKHSSQINLSQAFGLDSSSIGESPRDESSTPPISARATRVIKEEQLIEVERERQEKERQDRLEQERLDKERERQEKLEQERQEKERLERYNQEKERIERERAEEERKEALRLEQERIDNERLELELARMTLEKKELERKQKLIDEEKAKLELAEKERLASEKKERDRLAKEKFEKIEKEKLDKLYVNAGAAGTSSSGSTSSQSTSQPSSTSSSPNASLPATPVIHSVNNHSGEDYLRPPTATGGHKEKDLSSEDKDKSRGGKGEKDKDKDKEGNKTIGKFLSKFVHKGGSKKRQPIPFEQSPSSGSASPSPNSITPPLGDSRVSPLATSSVSSLETSAAMSSSPLRLTASVPLNPASNMFDIKEELTPPAATSPERITSFSVSIPVVSLSESQQQQHPINPSLNTSAGGLPLAESPSRIYLRKKTERSLNIGMVNGKHSNPSLHTSGEHHHHLHSHHNNNSPSKRPINKRSDPSLQFDHASTSNLIINMLLNEYPEFAKEWKQKNADDTGKSTEKINSIIKQHVEDCIQSVTQQTRSGNSTSIVNQINNSIVLNQLINEAHNDNQYQTLSLRYKMTKKLSTIKKKSAPAKASILPGANGANSAANDSSNSALTNVDEASQKLVVTASEFVEKSIELVNQAYEFSVKQHHSDSDTSHLAEPTEEVYDTVSKLLNLAITVGRIDDKPLFSSQIKNTQKLVSNSKNLGPGKVDATLVTCASMYRQFVERSLEKSIISQCIAVRAISIQMTTIIIGISSKPWDSNVQLQLFATANTFCECLVKLLSSVANKVYLKSLPLKDVDEELDALSEPEEDINIWLEGNSPANVKLDWISDEGSKTGRYVPKAGTLNKLIESLTSEKPYDISKFTKTFLLTYLSFTSARKLLEKLIQRYTVPDDKDQSFKIKVQVRVASFMKTWVERNYADFDPALLDDVKQFANSRLLADDHGDLARLLVSTIMQREADNTERLKQLANPSFPELMIPEGQKSPATLFNLLNDSEIARQLTLIEASIFGRIEANEFQEQSWSKEHLKHRSPNIMDLINRANKFSFWVASQILWQEEIADRVKVIEKFINIAKHLRDMNNFNSLMNIYAGLNQSSIIRLKKTFAQLSPAATTTYAAIEKLMNTSGSYKAYRQALKVATPPCLPYLPVILSDLTFMEDGNPDKIGHMINFQKRELICRVITEVQTFQQTKYDYPIVEPIHTLLLELPSSSDNELYQLSLLREPRETNGTIKESSVMSPKK